MEIVRTDGDTGTATYLNSILKYGLNAKVNHIFSSKPFSEKISDIHAFEVNDFSI